MFSHSKTKSIFLAVFLIALIVGFVAGMLGAGVYNYLIKEQPIVAVDKPGE